MPSSTAVELVHIMRYLNPYAKAANLAQALVYAAAEYQRKDNITASVFLFEHEIGDEAVDIPVLEELPEKN